MHGKPWESKLKKMDKGTKDKDTVSRPRNLSKVLKAMLSPNGQTKPSRRMWIMSQTKRHPIVTSWHISLLKICPTLASAGY